MQTSIAAGRRASLAKGRAGEEIVEGRRALFLVAVEETKARESR